MTSKNILTSGITFAGLADRDPRLRALLAKVKAIRSEHLNSDSFCANSWWYGKGLKEELTWLVGWLRRDDPVLGTSDAYDLAYDTLYDLLPDCRGAACCCFDPTIMDLQKEGYLYIKP